MAAHIVKVVPSFLAQGSSVQGELLDEGEQGVMVRTERGEQRFYPWSSVAYLVRNPLEVEDEPF